MCQLIIFFLNFSLNHHIKKCHLHVVAIVEVASHPEIPVFIWKFSNQMCNILFPQRWNVFFDAG